SHLLTLNPRSFGHLLVSPVRGRFETTRRPAEQSVSRTAPAPWGWRRHCSYRPLRARPAPASNRAATAKDSAVSATSTSSRVNPRCRSALRRRIPHLHAPLEGHLYLPAQFAPRHPQGDYRRRHLAGIAQTDMRFPATGLGQGGVLAIQLQLDLDQVLRETARPQLRVLQCMPLAGIVIQHHELE